MEINKSYTTPFGDEGQPQEEFEKIHDTWIARLRANLPEGVPIEDGWPATHGSYVDGKVTQQIGEGDGYCFQCGACCYCVTLKGGLGGDWGVCTNPASQYDGQAVFEHWTCRHFRFICEGEDNVERADSSTTKGGDAN